jgi:hypothetical protein
LLNLSHSSCQLDSESYKLEFKIAQEFSKEALRPANGHKKVRNMQNELDRIPPGLWAPLPIPAIKYLVRNGQRPASRILYAIVLHKGKSKSAIFPSYETLRLYANVGENSIKECLDILEKFGFIKVTRTRSGKKNQNRYEILDKAYNLDINPKSKEPKLLDSMICNACWNEVGSQGIKVENFVTWEGSREIRYKHIGCEITHGMESLIPVTESSRKIQIWQRSIMEIDKKENQNY